MNFKWLGSLIYGCVILIFIVCAFQVGQKQGYQDGYKEGYKQGHYWGVDETLNLEVSKIVKQRYEWISTKVDSIAKSEVKIKALELLKEYNW